MLFYVLQAVQGCSQPGDLAKNRNSGPGGPHGAADQALLQHQRTLRAPVQPSDAKVERALALAEAIVTSAGGDFKVSTGPLLIVADFPVKQREQVCCNRQKLSRPSSTSVPLAFEFATIVQDVLAQGTSDHRRRPREKRFFQDPMSILPTPLCDAVSGVLIVSPNVELRRELISRIKSERWRLMEAVSGAHALGQLESQDFQLLLLDPSLPDLNASEFHKLVRTQFPQLQILPLDRQTGLPLPSTSRDPLGEEMAGSIGKRRCGDRDA